MAYNHKIKSKKQYKIALQRLEEIFQAKPKTKEGDEAELLELLIRDYEDKHYNFELKSPEKINCPMCNGEGKIEQPHFKQKIMKEKYQTAIRMHKEGYSIREIAKAMGYKSPRSVHKLLKENKKYK